MNKLYSLAAVVLTLSLGPLLQAAETGTVHRKSDSRSVTGEVTGISPTEVVVVQRVGNREERIPANDIDRIEWREQPAAINLALSSERSGHLDRALQGYQEFLAGASRSSPVTADVEYLRARTLVKMAATSSEKVSEARTALNEFLSNRSDSYRFYDAQLLLGDLALSEGDETAALEAFRKTEAAPWLDYQMAAKIGAAKALLASDKVDEAKPLFDEVVQAAANSAAEKSRRWEAVLGQAKCLVHQQQYAVATESLKQVIEEVPAEDSRLLAEAYLNLGNAYSSEGQSPREAVMAYLHVDVIPSMSVHADLHAEALYHLTKLWPIVGQPARGAEAAAKLGQDYPNSEWSQKLTSGQ